MDPLEMKYRADIRSPAWTRVSPGGAWVVLNLMTSALRQPLVDPKDHNNYNVLVICYKSYVFCAFSLTRSLLTYTVCI